MPKTRKLQRECIHLQHLRKQKGARIHDLTTFKTVCSPSGASAKLRAVASIKSPEESDDFIQVLKSYMDTTPIVIKVQEPGRLLNMELAIHDKIKHCPNVVQYICDFKCLFDAFVWNKPLEVPRTICDNTGKEVHCIVMPYIQHDLANYMETTPIGADLLRSLVQQAGFALLDFHMTHYVCHNDINRGNILLQPGLPTILHYTIAGHTVVVDTLGYTVMYIDFQRGHMLDVTDDADDLLFQLARDEVSLLYDLMSKWTPVPATKSALRRLCDNVMAANSTHEIVRLLVNFNTV